jgi:hypothetical protein
MPKGLMGGDMERGEGRRKPWVADESWGRKRFANAVYQTISLATEK